MTKFQFQRELRAIREKELRLLREAERHADPDYVLNATGFWLERWQGKRHATRGTHRKPCSTTIPSNLTTVPAENSDSSR